MIKRLLFIFAFSLLFSLSLHCQTTHYYKLTKLIENSKENTSLTGGQFITISDSYCFDSDISGKSVGNGKLQYYKEYSSSHPTYIGESYFGNVTYRFSSDHRTLNVVVNKSH